MGTQSPLDSQDPHLSLSAPSLSVCPTPSLHHSSRIALQISVTPGDVPCQEPHHFRTRISFSSPLLSFLPKQLDTIFLRNSLTCCFARRPLSYTSSPPCLLPVRLPPTRPERSIYALHFSVRHSLGLHPLRILHCLQNACHLGNRDLLPHFLPEAPSPPEHPPPPRKDSLATSQDSISPGTQAPPGCPPSGLSVTLGPQCCRHRVPTHPLAPAAAAAGVEVKLTAQVEADTVSSRAQSRGRGGRLPRAIRVAKAHQAEADGGQRGPRPRASGRRGRRGTRRARPGGCGGPGRGLSGLRRRGGLSRGRA